MQRLITNLLLISSLILGINQSPFAQSPKALFQWELQPNYQLGQKAANYPGPRKPLPSAHFDHYEVIPSPIAFHSQLPTQRIQNATNNQPLPQGAFSVEMWLLSHVNQPVGALGASRSEDKIDWLVGYYGNELTFSLRTTDSKKTLKTKIKTRPWKKYWIHLVATFDGEKMRLYYNGQLQGEKEATGTIAAPEAKLELAAYLEKEPYMSFSNLVKRFKIYDQDLSETQINQNFNQLQKQVEQGQLFGDLFHFSAGPYLYKATDKGIAIAWESDRALQKAVLYYGTSLPLTDSITLSKAPAQFPFIGHFELDQLKPATKYFYDIHLIDQQGQRIKSNPLTFATAPSKKEAPVTFGIIGDTEARPQINHKVGSMLWDERPNFIINLGDLTDGGKEPHKFEWNYEYFTGVRPLCSRIPVFPVAGNGEGDLYWYNQYHEKLPQKGYYTFTYGSTQFFMLNSNDRAAFAPGGEQYKWLEEQLKQSTAKWKFVCHHHAPYSSDEDDYKNSWEEPSDLGDLKVRKIVPLYEQYGVDVVMFGHLHTYQRTMPIFKEGIDTKNGVVYLQGGGAGGNLEDFTPTRSWFSAKTYRGHHYFIISILGDELQMKMYTTEGQMKDFMTLKK